MKITRRQVANSLAEDFAQATSIEEEAEFRKLMIMEEILRLMSEQGVSRSQLADRMGVGASRVTAMLNGSNNFTIETLVRAGRALNCDLHQHFVPVGHQVRWSSDKSTDPHLALSEPAPAARNCDHAAQPRGALSDAAKPAGKRFAQKASPKSSPRTTLARPIEAGHAAP